MAAIDYLTEHGFSARVSGKRLIVSPASKLTEDDRQYIKLHRLELLAELAANDGQMRSSNWRVLLEGKVICVMIGEPMSRQEALEAAQWRWPDSDVR
ncbi:hypothetical protein [Ectopseudomonas khazarica]|uniref:hypothetical protein n=1 Tax=Ectopseudomonas khazarica TaxID=2502979 RepID=UPI0037C9A8E7|tara:strand:- start:356 stop:646 length:291 start_codon:yes stop_codon:yes gene_type:complete